MIHWAIPENIYTIRQMAFWNSESKGHSLNWKSKGIVRGWEGGGGGLVMIGIPKAWRGF